MNVTAGGTVIRTACQRRRATSATTSTLGNTLHSVANPKQRTSRDIASRRKRGHRDHAQRDCSRLEVAVLQPDECWRHEPDGRRNANARVEPLAGRSDRYQKRNPQQEGLKPEPERRDSKVILTDRRPDRVRQQEKGRRILVLVDRERLDAGNLTAGKQCLQPLSLYDSWRSSRRTMSAGRRPALVVRFVVDVLATLERTTGPPPYSPRGTGGR